MNNSPYDSLTSGNNTITEYVEVNMAELHPKEDAVIHTPPTPEVKPPKLKNITPLSAPAQYSRLNIKNIAGIGTFILPFEESILVPDTMRDMERVIFAEGRVDLAQSGKDNYGPDDFLTGEITVFTVYRPAACRDVSTEKWDNSAGTIDVIKCAIPFKTDRCWSGIDGDAFSISASIGNLTAEMINERKFVVRGDILLKITGVSAKELKVFKGADDDDLIVRNSKISATELLQSLTETTEISQEIKVKDGDPAPVKILKESFDICESHRQITSGKLVVHCVIHSRILYVGTIAGDSENSSMPHPTRPICLDVKTDFTQFILIKENVDPNMISINFSNCDLKMTIENRDKFLLSGNVTSQVQVYGNLTLDMVTDAYHKRGDLVFNMDSERLNSVVGTVSGELSSHEVIILTESERQPDTLLCGSCDASELETHFEKDQIMIEGTLPVSILATDSTGNVFTINRQMPIRGSLNMPALPQSTLHSHCSIRNFWFNQINSHQIEVNATLNVTIWAFRNEEFYTLENPGFAEDSETQRPSPMALYVVRQGDSLWDIAKRYKTDVSTLAETNELEENSIPAAGTKIFISR